MDLCDEADTANDGKISIEEYLTITKNYGIKVVPLLQNKPTFQISNGSAFQRWHWTRWGAGKQQQRTVQEWLHFPHKGHILNLDMLKSRWFTSFILFFLQNSNMFKQFDSVDPECDHHWDEKVSYIVQISQLECYEKFRLKPFIFFSLI